MHSFYLLLASTLAVQPIFAIPDGLARGSDIRKRTVDTFLASESPIVLTNLLCNIGSAGACVSGAASGLVIASPSPTNPNCTFELPLVLFGYSRLTLLQISTRGLVILL